VLGIGLGPSDANRRNGIERAKINDHPLRMERVILARICVREIRVALPVCIEIAVGEAGIADKIGSVIVRDPAMRERIAVGVPNELCRCRAADEISLPGRITPSPFGIPVPSFDMQFGVLPVGNRLPARGENLLDHFRIEELIGCPIRQTVDSGAESLGRPYGVRGVVRSNVNADRLSKHRGRERNERQKGKEAPVSRIPETAPLYEQPAFSADAGKARVG
jgi:hypothetical protein